jgi:hypothetical protein
MIFKKIVFCFIIKKKAFTSKLNSDGVVKRSISFVVGFWQAHDIPHA